MQLYLCQFISFFICQSTFLTYYFSARNIFQGFSLNFARTLGRAVDTFLNGLRVIHKDSLSLESKACICFEATRLSSKTEGAISPSFWLDMVKTGLSIFTFSFVEVDC